ncbi:acetylcholinesterase-1-like [Parasteatoda tepidariorum]|uniref:acetylcholinesterase-1-like n=1 Tax=Parasteatoda tepidariorum TaxID=114398 RepID=UPI001C71EBFE|nr:acetylcholinesterase-1-like [Parasteatoda tepidariorum]
MLKLARVTILISLMASASSDRVVMTNNGPVQGITVASGNPNIEAFLGIPYAEPPTGRLRFRKPVPKTPWSGVYDASNLSPPCIQNGTDDFYYIPKLANMSEDCLYLNIWVPYSRRSTGLKPVLIYIHGGAFNTGSSIQEVLDGTVLSQRGDILVINLNYRVGVLGFFTSLSDEAVGNFGLHDQVTALRWIKENVKSFGGDPNHLVLMGNSAGAMAVCGHLVSPLTRHIIKRGILQSGGGIQTMILDDNKRLLETAEKVSRITGCADRKFTLKENPKVVVACLKRLSYMELSRAEGLLMRGNPLTFFPRVGDDYLPKPVIDLIREGKMEHSDVIIGTNEEEGNFFLAVAIPQFFGINGHNNVQTINKKLAKQLLTLIFKNTEQTEEKEIAEFYAGSVVNETSDTFTKALGMSLGDYFIVCNSFYQAEFQSIGNSVYFYVLTRRPSSSPLNGWMGTTHFDEVQYTFGNPLFDNFTEEEKKFSDRIMDRWINFIRNGSPNIPNEIQWPKFTLNNTVYLDMNDEETIRIRPDNYRCEFWRDRFQANIRDSDIIHLRRFITSTASVVQLPSVLAFLSIIVHYIVKNH